MLRLQVHLARDTKTPNHAFAVAKKFQTSPGALIIFRLLLCTGMNWGANRGDAGHRPSALDHSIVPLKRIECLSTPPIADRLANVTIDPPLGKQRCVLGERFAPKIRSNVSRVPWKCHGRIGNRQFRIDAVSITETTHGCSSQVICIAQLGFVYRRTPLAPCARGIFAVDPLRATSTVPAQKIIDPSS